MCRSINHPKLKSRTIKIKLVFLKGRFSDILDPRTGWPAEGMLSVTVLAETAAEADALSTAFFVRGVEFARTCCDNRPGVSALLIPTPRRGQTLEPIVCGISDEVLFFEEPA